MVVTKKFNEEEFTSFVVTRLLEMSRDMELLKKVLNMQTIMIQMLMDGERMSYESVEKKYAQFDEEILEFQMKLLSDWGIDMDQFDEGEKDG